MATRKKSKLKLVPIERKGPPEGCLLLEDGSVFRGRSFGAKATSVGELVFHTSLTGYQEILTDPSYRKQILTFSAVQFGNEGFHEDDFESDRVWAAGCLVRDYSEPRYHWRKQRSVADVMKEFSVPGLSGVDTRRLILSLRDRGNQWAVISTETTDILELKKYFSKKLSMQGLSLTQEVSTKSKYTWVNPSVALYETSIERNEKGLKRCVVMDFGVKRQILRYLIDSGFQELIVVPALTSAKEIRALNPDAVFLSNGPGDPAAEKEIVATVRELLGQYPIFGICLGHQILALALGLKTFKLKFGHRAANHPVLNRKSDRVEITSQNHGFAVEQKEIPSDLEITHLNLNDGTIEGFKHKRMQIAALQFHPESSPGPRDSLQLFREFQQGRFL